MGINVANQITDMAIRFPYKRAVVEPKFKFGQKDYSYTHYTFIQLEKRINQVGNALKKMGVKKGHKVLLFVKPTKDFSAITFALFKIGAVPVLIDPGMGVKNFLKAIYSVKADVLIGIPKVHILKKIFKKEFRNIKIHITTSSFGLFAKSLEKKAQDEIFLLDAEDMNPNEHAAILFTSGGTGIPKGVIYTHDIFINQTKLLQNEFDLDEEDIDIPGFPLFALFTLAMGMTSCIPDMDPAKPSRVKPPKIIKNIMDQGATFVAGSPAIWLKVANYCIENRLTLPSVKYLVMFGAPIPVSLHEKFKKILVNGTTFTPYGATECLPVSNISGTEVLKETAELSINGKGTCVGLPFQNVTIRIIKPTHAVISKLDECKFLNNFEIGEIIVHSRTVTPSYLNMPNKTREAKIYEGSKIWHRMGDMGYLDDKGRLWFCGRKTHIVERNQKTYYTIPTEAIFNQHPEVEKSALIKLNKENILAIVIERKDRKTQIPHEKKFFSELKSLAMAYDHTNEISKFLLYKEFPVDVRHNIKIDRLRLAQEFNLEIKK